MYTISCQSMRSAIFDLDGTLVDSRAAIIASLHHVQKECGLACSASDGLQWALGPPLDEIMRRLLKSNHEAQIARAVAIYREHHPHVCLTHADLYPGIYETIRTLAETGHQLFVATSKLMTIADRVLEHFGLKQFLQGIYGPEMDGRLSQKADVIGHVLYSHHLDRTTTAMVGDREHDVLGARVNHVRAIAVAYGYGTREELTTAAPDAICERPEQLLVVL